MTGFYAILLIVAATVGARLGARCWKRRALDEIARLRELSRFSKKFFDSADILLSIADTPRSLIDVLAFLNYVIDKPRNADKFFKRYEKIYTTTHDGFASDPEVSAFLASHPEVIDHVDTAIVCGIIPLTYLGARWGEHARALSMSAYASDRKPGAVLVAIKETNRDNDFHIYERHAPAC